MDADTLKTETVAGIDSILSNALLMRFVSGEQERLLKAHRDLWLSADPATLASLLACYGKTVLALRATVSSVSIDWMALLQLAVANAPLLLQLVEMMLPLIVKPTTPVAPT